VTKTVNCDSALSVKSYFDLEAQHWEEKYKLHGSMHPRIAEFTFALEAYIPKGSPILDFGCGSGDITAYYLAAGYKPTGIDLAEQMIRWARERFACFDIPFVLLEDCELPFSSGVFSAFTASSVFEYTENYLTWFRELRRVCTKNALGLVTIPNMKHPVRSAEWLECYLYDLLRKHRSGSKVINSRRASYLQLSKVRLSKEAWTKALEATGWKCFDVSGRGTALIMLKLRAQ
jgi:ubiquinone/menaquinone biosynthesis C-methylase UbiE